MKSDANQIGLIAKNNPSELNKLVEFMQLECIREIAIVPHLPRRGSRHAREVRQMAAPASTRTTQLYDRREDRVTLDEVVKISIRG